MCNQCVSRILFKSIQEQRSVTSLNFRLCVNIATIPVDDLFLCSSSINILLFTFVNTLNWPVASDLIRIYGIQILIIIRAITKFNATLRNLPYKKMT